MGSQWSCCRTDLMCRMDGVCAIIRAGGADAVDQDDSQTLYLRVRGNCGFVDWNLDSLLGGLCAS